LVNQHSILRFYHNIQSLWCQIPDVAMA
jgi:hypothetical protein